MSESDSIKLPPSWILTTLGEVTEPNRPRHHPRDFPDLPFIGMEHIESHSMKLLGIVPAKTMKSSAVHFWPGDVLYGRLRPYLNKVYCPNFEGLCSAEFLVFPSCEYLTRGYLQFLLNSTDFVSFASHLNEGDRPRVDFSQLTQYPFPLPPLAEQHKIVAEVEKQLTRLETATVALRHIQAKLVLYRASVLKTACEGRLAPTEAELARAEGRGYETANSLLEQIVVEESSPTAEASHLPRPIMPKRQLPGIPEGWAWTTIREITSVGPQNGLYLPQSAYGSGTPIIRIDDFQADSSRSTAELRRVRIEPEIEKVYSLCDGDLLINRVNSPSHLGKTLLIRGSHLPAVFESNMMRLHVGNCVSVDYIQLYLKSPAGRARLIKEAKWAVNQASINQGDVLRTSIPLPPLAEQKRIVEEVQRRLSIVENLASQVEAGLRRAVALRSAILKKAFEGKLVANYSMGESASFLLDQSRKSRESAADVRPRRGRGVKREGSPQGPQTGPVEPKAFEPSRPPDAVEISDPEAAPGEANFLDLPREEQIDHVWESLLSQGPLDKDAAIRTAAQLLRDHGLVQFQRLREGGPLYAAIAAAVDRGIREGSFDRPKRGLVRALLPDPKNYTAKEWTLCLLQSLDGQPVPQEDALRNAAEWAREALGLDFARLRKDGVILRGLRAALDEAVKMGEVVRTAGMVSCPSD